MNGLPADVVLKRVPGATDDARRRAADAAADTHREMVPVRVFEQGGRKMLDGVLPIRVLNRVLAYNSAEKGTSAARALNAMNRPQDPEHTKAIVRYLQVALENGEHYIIPSLTLNCTREVEVYVPDNGYTPITGYAVLPDEAAIKITDGQHRFVAISRVLDNLRGTPEGERFLRDSVPVMMTIESNAEQVHQDFADAGRTKPLPSSLLAVYDTRQPANRAVMAIANQVPLFNGRVDATSTTLSVNSPFIFLVNQVRQFVKSSLTGKPSMQEKAFVLQAEVLSNKDAFDRWTASREVFLRVMTDLIPDWKEISELSPPGGPDYAEVLARTKGVRARRGISMAAAFLSALGLVSYVVLEGETNGPVNRSDLEQRLSDKLGPLSEIEWARSGELWQGNLVESAENDRIRTQSGPVTEAASALLGMIGLSLPRNR